MSPAPHDPDPAADFGSVLRQYMPFLDAEAAPDPLAMQHKSLHTTALMVSLLKKIQATVHSELEVLGKHHAPIKTMAEALAQQGLLDIEQSMRAAMAGDSAEATRVKQYCDLLFRWWSAILAGVQSAVLQVPDEVSTALNPADWDVQKKRWSSEESTYWDHFKFVIRSETPLTVGDRIKATRGAKTLEAYSILGQQQTP